MEEEERSWRLWFGIWVLYFHRMLNITYQVLEVDWPLTLSAKIDGYVTWVICYLPPMEIMEFLRIADVLSAVFQLDPQGLGTKEEEEEEVSLRIEKVIKKSPYQS